MVANMPVKRLCMVCGKILNRSFYATSRGITIALCNEHVHKLIRK